MDNNSDITFGDKEFWTYCNEYMFNSIWPGANDFFSLYNVAGGFSLEDRFLHIACGPGDLVIAASHYIVNGISVGVDYSENSLNFFSFKLKHPHTVAFIMCLARLFSQWWFAKISDSALISILKKISYVVVDRSILEQIYKEVIFISKHYSVLCPYGVFFTHLKKYELISPGKIPDVMEIRKIISDSISDPVYARILSFPEEIKSKEGIISYKKADAFNLPFDADSFDKVLAFEIEPLLRKRGYKWLDEAVRICKKGGLILFCGVRVPESIQNPREVENIKNELKRLKSITIVKEGKKQLESWWDISFNNPSLNTYLFTPFILLKKHGVSYA